MTQPKYIVAQVGARRGYAVPAILESAGMLSRFYTDICGNSGLGQLLAMGAPLSSGLAKLAARRVPSQVNRLTRTFPLRTALYASREHLRNTHGAQYFRTNLRWQCQLGRAAARSGFGDATHLFSMLGELPTLVVAAKKRGVRIVSEVYILLSTERIMAEERKRFPGWEPGWEDLDSVRREFFSSDVLLTQSDFFICPSEAVRDDLILMHGVKPESAAVVPYGINSHLLKQTAQPRPGRVLFAGTAELRKGIHYLAMAAKNLATRASALEFRVAGNVTRSVASQPICRHLNFLGRVPRDRIHEEFQTADVFVLPSLAEGSAEVTYEALAAGVPVITTKSAGSVVRDGVEGKIVPERDPDALAFAIQELVEDRTLHNRMAVAARKRAMEFTWDKYAERLLVHLRDPLGSLVPASQLPYRVRAAEFQENCP
jgi:glycosyltransferase involved in cell wall biosynthesis